jgi:hypothetical protein
LAIDFECSSKSHAVRTAGAVFGLSRFTVT